MVRYRFAEEKKYNFYRLKKKSHFKKNFCSLTSPTVQRLQAALQLPHASTAPPGGGKTTKHLSSRWLFQIADYQIFTSSGRPIFSKQKKYVKYIFFYYYYCFLEDVIRNACSCLFMYSDGCVAMLRH